MALLCDTFTTGIEKVALDLTKEIGMRRLYQISMFVLALFMLTACGGSPSSGTTADDLLPLAEGKPTFFFFFTDN